MTTVLIVDDDTRMSSALADELVRQGYRARTSDSADAALEVLLNDKIDVLVTDLRMSGRDGLDLIRMVRASSPETRAVLMSAFATAKDYKVAMDLGVVDVLTKPFMPDDLEAAIRKALDSKTGVQGMVHGLSLVDVLQMFHFARRSLVVQIGGGAAVHMKDGELVHASTGTESGEPALKRILEAQVGSIRTSPPVAAPVTIHRSFQNLLLDLVRTIDEQGRPSGPPPSSGTPGGTPAPELVFDLQADDKPGSNASAKPIPTLVPPAAPPAAAIPIASKTVTEERSSFEDLETAPAKGSLRGIAIIASLLAAGVAAFAVLSSQKNEPPTTDAPPPPTAIAPPSAPPSPPVAPPPAKPAPAVREVRIDTTPTGLTLVDAATETPLGTTPFMLELPVGEKRLVRASYEGVVSAPLLVPEGVSSHVFALGSWYATLQKRPAAARAAQKNRRREPVFEPPAPAPPPAVIAAPPPAAPPPPARPSLPIVDGKRPSLGTVDDDKPTIGTVEEKKPKVGTLD